MEQFKSPESQPADAMAAEVEDSGKIDVNMFRQHSSPSPSQDDLEAEANGGHTANLEQQSPEGADGVVTNPVLVGAMQQTSKFDVQYEHDMDGGNVTLDLKTDRLKQFPEAYEMLHNISNPDQRILMKQQVIFQYEPLLRKQIKAEKKKRKKEKQRQQQMLKE